MGAGGTERGDLRRTRWQTEGKENDVKVKNEKTARDNRYDEGDKEGRCGKRGTWNRTKRRWSEAKMERRDKKYGNWSMNRI